MRIQVLPVPVHTRTDEPLFARYHGELLIHCVQGTCVVVTERQSCELAEGDQALLVDGEPFRVERAEGREAVVQLVWAPGPNLCRTCWERAARSFAPSPE